MTQSHISAIWVHLLENVDKENDENVGQEGSEEDNSDVNITTIAGLLETCAIIWGGIKEQLEKVMHFHKGFTEPSYGKWKLLYFI